MGSNPISSTNFSNALTIALHRKYRLDGFALEDTTSQRTLFLSRLVGLYCILISLAQLSHKQASVEMAKALVHNAPVLFVVSLMAVVAGLAMILSHNVWSGGALPVVITLLGWLALLKGVLFLCLSPEAADKLFLGGYRYEELFYLYAAIPLLLGIYLTYAGFKSKAR
ncbi:MAG TPA: hypothetical protein VJW51_10905 [Candidatus Acidoferrales bacterium]|nr:hypothetical protein [Candidatus Acidoferrales bacterium]